MAEFVVEQVMATGEDHPTYGTEYYVKFENIPDRFKLWYKNEPAVGFVQAGNIENGKFKKEKKELVPGQSNVTERGHTVPKKTYAATNADRGDGMRQGMCFNNAATYVAQLLATGKKTAGPNEWASTVHAYAEALYQQGDLKEAPEDVAVEDNSDFLDKLFGTTKEA